MLRKSLSWAPTIALAWLWGLGFFYSIHVTYTYGWTGLLAFAVPNAVGLGAFGCVADRFTPKAGAEAFFHALSGGYVGAFLAYQVAAVAITIFAFSACFLDPVLGAYGLPVAAMAVLAAMICGHRCGLPTLKRLHLAYLAAGVAAIVPALLIVARVPDGHQAARPDATFWGLLVPTVLGFLLGPWLDVQQWQRVVEIRRQGGSPTLSYLAGGALFFVLIVLNAAMATALPDAAPHVDFAGMRDATLVLGRTMGRFASLTTAGNGVLVGLFSVWVAVAMLTTLDSAYAATRWVMAAAASRSRNPLLGFLPAAATGSPMWVFGAAILACAACGLARVSVLDMMVPFATLFVGFEACLVRRVAGGGGSVDPLLCWLLGLFALCLFAVGYFSGLPALLPVATVLPLLCVAGMGRAGAPAEPPVRLVEPVAAPAAADIIAPTASAGFGVASRGQFDGNWFKCAFVPTYDDTNSVGNVYFANYMRWVGKTRELFFLQVMPDFDLKTTKVFILTRDFYHRYVREMREFEDIVVRLRIGQYDRKFVTLEHEIRNAAGEVVGKGNQRLMFVDSTSYRLIDIPGEIMARFLPYASRPA